MSATLEAALAYARRGRPVFPVKPDKTPYTPQGFKNASTSDIQIREWWGRWSDALIGVPTGDGWFVLDVDDLDALAKLEAQYGPLPETQTARTPRGGRHYCFGGSARTGTGVPVPGIDIRGYAGVPDRWGGYVVVPPSPGYEWVSEVGIAAAPPWLTGLLAPRERRAEAAPCVDGDIPHHQRNTTLASLAGTMRRRGFSEAAIAAALLVENRDRCKPPLDEADVRKTARSVARYEPADDATGATGSLAELSDLLGLDEVGKHIDQVRMFGRGSTAIAHILLDGGERILLDPLGKFTTASKLSAEIRLQAGAPVNLKWEDVLQTLSLIYHLADHHESVETVELASEVALEYLRNAAVAEVDMSNQESRWKAFSHLDRAGRTDIVLLDSETGVRYVRTGWFSEYLRSKLGPPDAALRALLAAGWRKRGSEGEVKATSPKLKSALKFRFYEVPKGWED